MSHRPSFWLPILLAVSLLAGCLKPNEAFEDEDGGDGTAADTTSTPAATDDTGDGEPPSDSESGPASDSESNPGGDTATSDETETATETATETETETESETWTDTGVETETETATETATEAETETATLTETAPVCVPSARFVCVDNAIHELDSCDDPGAPVTVCGEGAECFAPASDEAVCCTLAVRSACDENGDARWYDSCERPGAVAEDCAELHGVCETLSATAAACACANRWEGATCDTCPAGWDAAADCAACLPHFDPADGCASCTNAWQGASCETCPAHWNADKDCAFCAWHWGGAACGVCQIGHGGVDCATCQTGYHDATLESGHVCLPGASTACAPAWNWLLDGRLPPLVRGDDEELTVVGPANQPMVSDPLTGMVWRRCLVGQTWSASSGTCTGAATTFATRELALAACNNAWGGEDDWRLPNASELVSLADFGRADPAMDMVAFPGFSSASHPALWSSTAAAAGGGSLAFFSETGLLWNGGPGAYGVLCVRAGRQVGYYYRYAVGAADGSTAVDLWSGLEWRRCPVGRSWNGASCGGAASLLARAGAVVACAGSYAGKSDWRVPNVLELSTLLNFCQANGAACPPGVVALSADFAWTQNPIAYDPSYFWAVDFNVGQLYSRGATDKAQVACVRDAD